MKILCRYRVRRVHTSHTHTRGRLCVATVVRTAVCVLPDRCRRALSATVNCVSSVCATSAVRLVRRRSHCSMYTFTRAVTYAQRSFFSLFFLCKLAIPIRCVADPFASVYDRLRNSVSVRVRSVTL